MQTSKSDSVGGFSSQVFAQTKPARLFQGDWMSDKVFLDELKRSWILQYAEYIGNDKAVALVDQMHKDGSLYEHNPTLTLQAMIDEKRVGISALRQLGKNRELALITMLEVSKSQQKKGIGRQMVLALESASDHLMAHVSVHRPHVKLFYERLGFSALQQSVVDHHGNRLLFDVMAKRTVD